MSEEKELLLYSESYPLNEKKERKRVKPIAECHKYLKGIKIDPSQIIYKPLAPKDLDEIKKLHQEWFPVKYEDEIFNQSILYNQGAYFTVGAYYYIETEKGKYQELILGLILCQWIYANKFFFQTTSKDLEKEISDALNYEQEAKLFLSKEKFYYCAYILSVGVVDECRKMNIATKMLKSILNYAIGFDLCVGVYLTVISDNFSAKKFYEKNGMVCVNHIENFYDVEEKKYPCDVYVKIFTRKEKDKCLEQFSKMMTFKQRIMRNILKMFYFLVKIFMLVFLCQCFKKKIKTE